MESWKPYICVLWRELFLGSKSHSFIITHMIIDCYCLKIHYLKEVECFYDKHNKGTTIWLFFKFRLKRSFHYVCGNSWSCFSFSLCQTAIMKRFFTSLRGGEQRVVEYELAALLFPCWFRVYIQICKSLWQILLFLLWFRFE